MEACARMEFEYCYRLLIEWVISDYEFLCLQTKTDIN